MLHANSTFIRKMAGSEYEKTEKDRENLSISRSNRILVVAYASFRRYFAFQDIRNVQRLPTDYYRNDDSRMECQKYSFLLPCTLEVFFREYDVPRPYYQIFIRFPWVGIFKTTEFPRQKELGIENVYIIK